MNYDQIYRHIFKIEQEWTECHFDKRANVIGYALKRVVMFLIV